MWIYFHEPVPGLVTQLACLPAEDCNIKTYSIVTSTRVYLHVCVCERVTVKSTFTRLIRHCTSLDSKCVRDLMAVSFAKDKSPYHGARYGCVLEWSVRERVVHWPQPLRLQSTIAVNSQLGQQMLPSFLFLDVLRNSSISFTLCSLTASSSACH